MLGVSDIHCKAAGIERDRFHILRNRYLTGHAVGIVDRKSNRTRSKRLGGDLPCISVDLCDRRIRTFEGQLFEF